MKSHAAVVQSGLGREPPKLLTRVQIPAAAPCLLVRTAVLSCEDSLATRTDPKMDH
jgi:hypothetical protein